MSLSEEALDILDGLPASLEQAQKGKAAVATAILSSKNFFIDKGVKTNPRASLQTSDEFC